MGQKHLCIFNKLSTLLRIEVQRALQTLGKGGGGTSLVSSVYLLVPWLTLVRKLNG